MSAAYYDFYAEQNASFVVKINMLDKFSNQICMSKSQEAEGIYIDVPAELAAIGYTRIYSLEGIMSVKSSLTAGSSGNELLFTGNAGVTCDGTTPETSVGQLYFKGKGDDHNLVIYYPDITINPGTYFYDFQIRYCKGFYATGGTPVTRDTSTAPNTLRILQGKFIIIPKVQ